MYEQAHEVRIHGRGGQGAVLASKILAKALVAEGKHVTAIPAFGFERRGAPVAAFLRYADAELRALTNIYRPDSVICIDPTVAQVIDIFAGMAEGGTLVQATKRPVADLNLPPSVARVGLCDAVGIAMDVFGRQITNSVMLGAFARTTGIVGLDTLKNSLVEGRDARSDQNMRAVERGYHETRVFAPDGRELP